MTRRLPSLLLSFGTALLIAVLTFGRLFAWEGDGGAATKGIGLEIGVATLFVCLSLLLGRVRKVPVGLAPEPFALVLGLLFFSNVIDRQWMLFPNPAVRGDLLLWAGVAAILFWRRSRQWMLCLVLATPAIFLWSFFEAAQGRPIFSDDHASFFYRLALLHEVFPDIPNYYPFWNAGIEVRDYLVTGVGNLYALIFPWMLLFDLESIYNAFVGGLLFVLLPLSVATATWIEERDGEKAGFAALLSLGSSLLWYRWSLKYGTMGFATSAIFLPLNFLLCTKILSRDRQLSRLEAVAFPITVTLMCFWSVSVVAFVPVFVLGAFRLPIVFRKRAVLAATVAIVALNLPWMSALLTVSHVNKFLAVSAEETAPRQDVLPDHPGQNWNPHKQGIIKRSHAGTGLGDALRRFQENFSSANLLLVLLAVPGIALFRRRFTRNLFVAEAVWLLGLGTFGTPLKPQLELDRMFLLLQLLLCIPAGMAVTELFRRAVHPNRSRAAVLLGSVVFGFLTTGLFSAASVVQNRSLERFHFKPALFEDLIAQIQAHSGNGRVLFSGFVLHQFGEVHIAPLPLLSGGVPMYANYHIHKSWERVDVIPREVVAGGESAVESYLDLLNISAVVAHEPKWIRYFEERPAQYQQTWNDGPIHFFRRIDPQTTYVLEGAGELLSQDSVSITILPHTRTLTLKFQYYPFLQSTNCEVSGRDVAPALRFVRLENCEPGRPAIIRATPVHRRIFERFFGSEGRESS